MTHNPSPLTPFPGGVRVSLRLTPKASSERLGGVVAGADGKTALKAWVSAAPEDGKANAALLKLLAKLSGLPVSAMSVVKGHTQRLKLVEIAGEPGEIMRRMQRAMGEGS